MVWYSDNPFIPPSSVVRHLPKAAVAISSVFRRLLSVLRLPPSIFHHPSSAFYHPSPPLLPSSIFPRLSSTLRHPSSRPTSRGPTPQSKIVNRKSQIVNDLVIPTEAEGRAEGSAKTPLALPDSTGQRRDTSDKQLTCPSKRSEDPA